MLTARFDLGTYVARTLAVAVSTIVLIALLSELIRLHAALSRANMMLERERLIAVSESLYPLSNGNAVRTSSTFIAP
jgi:hypothetical protein